MKKARRQIAGKSRSVHAPPQTAARARRRQRLCRALDIDAFAASIILDLRQELDALERELELWRAAAGRLL